MNYRPLRLGAAAMGVAAALTPCRAYAFGWPGNNDSIFPPAASAKQFIDFDKRGFLIHGKRVFIVSGDLHYWRIPRELWRDRLLRIKRAGYNGIQTYPFWALSEPKEGTFDFTGNRDLDAFLKLVKELDMYAVVRAGPYINADADSGGLPLWLRFKPGLLPMTDNKPFYDAVLPYWDRLFPILKRNQITIGGSVIMVQLENEHNSQTGTDLPDAYFKRYLAYVRSYGMVVPLFFSGLNHSPEPAGAGPFDTSQRTSPWFSTEFWTGWVADYGVPQARGEQLERATWGVIAYGGAGYTHYEMAGGTSFGTLNCNENASAYDFGSPIGQAGDFRFDYYGVKRAAMFATSFPDILANSGAAEGGDGVSQTNNAIRLTVRTGPAGAILFANNPTGAPLTTQIKAKNGTAYPAAGPITVQPGDFVPIVENATLPGGVKLTLAAAHTLGVARVGHTTTVVIYGEAGEPAELHFNTGASVAHVASKPEKGTTVAISPGTVIFTTTIVAGQPITTRFRVGAEEVQVLSETSDLADHTWFVPIGGTTHIITGPDYVGEAAMANGKVTYAVETRGTSAPATPLVIRSFVGNKAQTLRPVSSKPTNATAKTARTGMTFQQPRLKKWMSAAGIASARPSFNATGWLSTVDPVDMAADGSRDAYGWYRATVTVAKAGPHELYLPVANDWVTAFVNGKRVPSNSVGSQGNGRTISLDLPAGKSTLAILAAHNGRNKLYNVYSAIDTIDIKGIYGPVTLSDLPTSTAPVTGLRWHTAAAGGSDANVLAAESVDTSGPGWADCALNQDIFAGAPGFAWVRATLPKLAGKHHILSFQSVDDNATIYLNGKLLGSHQGVNAPFGIDLDPAWKTDGDNNVAILVENGGGPGGIYWSLSVRAGELQDAPPVKHWLMRGGVPLPPESSPDWKPVRGEEGTGVPTWYRARFTARKPKIVDGIGSLVLPPAGPYPIYRAKWTGMSHGFVWLNGHNLGRYPELSPIDSIYLPECWLKDGENTLEIFDEEGNSPSHAEVVVKADESRTISLVGN